MKKRRHQTPKNCRPKSQRRALLSRSTCHGERPIRVFATSFIWAVISRYCAAQCWPKKKKKCQFTELPKGAGHTAVIFFSALDRAVNMENNDEPLLRASVAVPPSSCMQTIGSGIKLTTIFECKKYGSARRWQEAGETSSGCSHFNFRLPPPQVSLIPTIPIDSQLVQLVPIPVAPPSGSCRMRKKANRIDSSSIFFPIGQRILPDNRWAAGKKEKNQIGGSTSPAIC